METNLEEKKDKSNIVNYYSNISDAIKDYVNEIKDNFIAKVEIKTDKTGIKFKNKSQVEIYKMAREKFKETGNTYFINNNEIIHVSNSDIKESVAKIIKSGYQKELLSKHLELFAHLDKIIENGIIIANANETKCRYQNLNWKYYIVPIIINNRKYIIQFDVVTKYVDNQKHFRVLRLFKIKDIKMVYSNH